MIFLKEDWYTKVNVNLNIASSFKIIKNCPFHGVLERSKHFLIILSLSVIDSSTVDYLSPSDCL